MAVLPFPAYNKDGACTCGCYDTIGNQEDAISDLRRERTELVGALESLLGFYQTVVEIHARVQMDTPEDKALHARAVETFRDAPEAVREVLRFHGVTLSAGSSPRA